MVFETNDILIKIRAEADTTKAERDIDRLLQKTGRIRRTGGVDTVDIGGRRVARQEAVQQLAIAEKQKRNQREQLKQQNSLSRSTIGVIGSMFLLAAVAGTITTALQPAIEAAGVFEIISLIFLILFLPAIIKLIPVLIKMLRFVIDMPKELKVLIGFLAIATVIIALVAGAIISLILAIGGLLAFLTGSAIGLAAGEALLVIGALITALGILALAFAALLGIITVSPEEQEAIIQNAVSIGGGLAKTVSPESSNLISALQLALRLGGGGDSNTVTNNNTVNNNRDPASNGLSIIDIIFGVGTD